ncbi:MAG: Zn-dependent hydrolase, partial [Bacteroidales bacterium]|nr:Zn-dependent hydrolase [Bacteroidales bacterium]
MKNMLTYCLLVTFACLACAGCKKKAAEAPQQSVSPCKAMVEEYAWFDLTSDLVAGLSENEKHLIPIFVRISEIMDDLFWKQTFGDKTLLDTISDVYAKEFAMIQYGPWNRLDANKPFVSGYGEKRPGCCYYPDDITADEYEAFENADKGSLYTVLRRDDEGKLKSVWYHEEYAAEIGEVCRLLDSVA